MVQGNFRPTPDPPPTLSTEDWEALARTVGGPVTYEPPPYTIDEAALNVGGALASGIAEAGGPTVAWPIQGMTVSNGVVTSHQLTSTQDLQNWEPVTASSDVSNFPLQGHP